MNATPLLILCTILAASIAQPARPCQRNGTFRTETQVDWGATCSATNTACFRDQNFNQCFSRGITLGCPCCTNSSVDRIRGQCPGHTLTLSTSRAIQQYLPQSGRSMVLTQDYFNPTTTSSGRFGGQVTALALSLGFDDCLPNFGSDCDNTLQDLFICDTRERRTGAPNCAPFFGMTIGDLFTAANQALGGCCTGAGVQCDPQSLNECVTLINQAFSGGRRLSQLQPSGIFSRNSCRAPPPSCESGCSDGEREGFTDLAAYQCIAACDASWSIPGVVGKSKNCNGQSGDDITARTLNARCSVADACAPGWHVCATSAEVASSLTGGSCSDAGQGFYVSQQSGGGCGICAIGNRTCAPGTCDRNCAMNQNMRNDIFGCGSIGSTPDSSCAPLNVFGNDGCSALPNSIWRCTAGLSEADNVVKTRTEGGGALCCKDTCNPRRNLQC